MSGVVLSASGIIGGDKCKGDSLRPECSYLCVIDKDKSSCVSPVGCFRLEESALINKLESIRRLISSCSENGLPYPCRGDVWVLLQVIDDLKAKNSILERNLFQGVDSKGRTDIVAFAMDLMRLHEEDDVDYPENDVVLALWKRRQA